MARKASKKGRSSSVPSRKRSEYAKANRQTDGSRFVIVTQDTISPTFSDGAVVATPGYVSAMSSLLNSDMFVKLTKMYDEFRIRSLRVKIVPQATQVGAAYAGNIALETAFDRNGRLAMDVGVTDGAHPHFWLEKPAPLSSYSSFQSRQLLAYTNVAQMRTLAPSGATESFYLPTSYCTFLMFVGQEGIHPNLKDVHEKGYQIGLVPYGFRPVLCIGASSTTPVANGLAVPVRLEWSFDISVRGLRKGADAGDVQ